MYRLVGQLYVQGGVVAVVVVRSEWDADDAWQWSSGREVLDQPCTWGRCHSGAWGGEARLRLEDGANPLSHICAQSTNHSHSSPIHTILCSQLSS